MEHKKICPVLIKCHISGYFICKYVDDFLIIYDQRKPNVNKTLSEFKEQQPNIKFAWKRNHTTPLTLSTF
jgi:hypothetical protein